MRKSLFLATAATAMLFASGSPDSAFAAKKAKAPAAPKFFTEKEKATGAKYHPEIMKEFGGAWESPQTAYVVRVGKKIAFQSGLAAKESDFTVTLLNSPVNNAFAIEGGYVYITRQLVALCNSEAEMAGVLGHEVGHTGARHSKSRQKQSTIAGIAGVAGTILGAVLGDNGGIVGALGQGLKEYSGTVAQLFSLSYSRKQEEEADDLGIQYLSKAGYDPLALSSMLTSLALQTQVDQAAAGHLGGPMPEWASTHPDPAKRVVRAATGAAKYPKSSVRNADAHYTAINGMLFDDDPKEGVIEGQDFIHPVLKLKFSVPTGYGMANSSSAVQVNGSGGKALFSTAAYSGDKTAYVAAAFKAIAGENQQITPSAITETTVNGIPAFSSTADVQTQQGQVRVTVYAYEFATNQAFHFTAINPVNTSPFDTMFKSVSRITQAEAAAVKPRKLQVVKVAKNDTVATLAAKMAYKSLQTERFRALNGLSGTATVKVGQKVKIVTY